MLQMSLITKGVWWSVIDVSVYGRQRKNHAWLFDIIDDGEVERHHLSADFMDVFGESLVSNKPFWKPETTSLRALRKRFRGCHIQYKDYESNVVADALAKIARDSITRVDEL